MKVGLFITCLVDIMRPQAGFSSVKLLKKANCTVIIPPKQTCCGQPAYNCGAKKIAQKLARQVIRQFESFDYIVVPSGSCAGMLHKHYPKLLKDDKKFAEKAQQLAARTYELIRFLNDICHLKISAQLNRKVTYHSSCSSLRESGLTDQSQNLLNQVKGLETIPLEDADTCCGFGGAFCIKFPQISNKMTNDKVRNIVNTGAEILTSADLGCLMNIIGKLQKQHGNRVKALHIAEILAGYGEQPGIGESESSYGSQ